MPRVKICDKKLQLPYQDGLEMYAVYDSSDNSLTLFRDRAGKYTNRQVIGTKTYYIGLERRDAGLIWDGWKLDVTAVYIEDKYKPLGTTLSQMFENFRACKTFEGLDLIDTTETTDLKFMFHFCYEAEELDLSSFDTKKVVDFTQMFSGSPKLKTIYVSDGFAVNTTETLNMFYDCTSLVGGQGTRYNDDYLDGTYARIDNPPDSPGYFTAKE